MRKYLVLVAKFISVVIADVGIGVAFELRLHKKRISCFWGVR